MSVGKVYIGLAAIALLAGCTTQPVPATMLSSQQQSGLASYEEIYRSCVSQAARTIDDGRTETIRVAAEALDYCEPERQDLAQFLDSTPLPQRAKDRYVSELLKGATGQSADVLRLHRNSLIRHWPGLRHT